MKCHMFTCYLCSPPVDVKEHQIQGHLRLKHKTTTSTKCCKCNFLGAKNEVVEHYNKEHSTGGRHGIRQVFISFIRAKRDAAPNNRENSGPSIDVNRRPDHGASTSGISSSSLSKPSTSTTSSNQSKAPVAKKPIIVPNNKKPNLMSNLKRTQVVRGFSSWKQEAVRNQVTSNKTVQPRSLPHSSSIYPQSSSSMYPPPSSSTSFKPTSSSAYVDRDKHRRKMAVLNNKSSSSSNVNIPRKPPAPVPLRKDPSNTIKTYSKTERAEIRGKKSVKCFQREPVPAPESKHKLKPKFKPKAAPEPEPEPKPEPQSESSDTDDPDYVDLVDSPSPLEQLSTETSSEIESEDEPEPEIEIEEESQDIQIIEPESSVFPYISSKNEHERGSSIYFCLFCDKTYTKFNLALHHIRVHVKFGYHCKYGDNHFDLSPSFMAHHIRKEHRDQPVEYKDDHIERRNVNSWIIDFLNEQYTSSRLIDEENVIEKPKSWVQCPVCVKAAKYKKKKPFKFDSIRTFERHFWQHTRWWRVDCVLCGASVQRAHQRDHLAEHDIVMDGTNLQIFEVYFQERIDSITANKLESIVETKEKEFYSRYGWYRNVQRHLNISLIPCDSELNFLDKQNPQPIEPMEEDSDKEKSSKQISPGQRLSQDEHSNSCDIESEEAIKLAMKILDGGVSPEFDDSSIENEPPSVSSVDSRPINNNKKSNVKTNGKVASPNKQTPIDVDMSETDTVSKEGDGEEADTPRKDQHLTDISSVQNTSPEGISSVTTSENLIANTPPASLRKNSQSSPTPLTNANNLPNERVLLSPECSLQQMLNEIHQETLSNSDGPYKVQTLINSNVDSLVAGDSVISDLLPDSTQPVQSSIPVSVIDQQPPNPPSSVINPPSSCSSLVNLLKRPSTSSGGPPAKICKEKVQSVIQQVLALKEGWSNNNNLNAGCNNTKEYNTPPILADPNLILPRSTPIITAPQVSNLSRPIFSLSFPAASDSLPTQTAPSLMAALNEPISESTNNNNFNLPVADPPQYFQQPQQNQNQHHQKQQQQQQQNVDEDDDIYILETRINARPQQPPQPQPQPQPKQMAPKSFNVDIETFKKIVGPIYRSMVEKSVDGNVHLKIPIEKLLLMAKLSEERKLRIPSPNIPSINISLADASNNHYNFRINAINCPNNTNSLLAPTSTSTPIRFTPSLITYPANTLRPVVAQSTPPPTPSQLVPAPAPAPTPVPVRYPQSSSVPPFRPNYVVNRVQVPHQVHPPSTVVHYTPQRPLTTSISQSTNQAGVARIIRFQYAQQQPAQQQSTANCYVTHQRFIAQQHPSTLPAQVQTQQVQSVMQIVSRPYSVQPNVSHPDINPRSASVNPSGSCMVSNGSPAPIMHHPSPPPPYHQHDQHYQYPVNSYVGPQQQQQQQCNYQQPQQLQPQPQQLQPQQLHQQQNQPQIQQQQQQQFQLQHQQQHQHQQQLQSQQVQYQLTPQQQNIYHHSVAVSEQVSSMVDHSYTTALQYQQITHSQNVIHSNPNQTNNHLGGLIENHSASIMGQTQQQQQQQQQMQNYDPNTGSPNSVQQCAPNNIFNPHIQVNQIENSQQSMVQEDNNLNTYTHPLNWPVVDDTTLKQPLNDHDDIQVVANFANSPGHTFWKPDPSKIFSRDSQHHHAC